MAMVHCEARTVARSILVSEFAGLSGSEAAGARMMDAVLILSAETGETLIEHQAPGSRIHSGMDFANELWQELERRRKEGHAQQLSSFSGGDGAGGGDSKGASALTTAGGASSLPPPASSRLALDMAQVPTVIAMPQCYLFHVKNDPLIFCCATQREAPPLKVLEFLSHLIDVCVEYFGSDLTEDEIKDNAPTIYQLLGEMLDGGIPYLTEASPEQAPNPASSQGGPTSRTAPHQPRHPQPTWHACMRERERETGTAVMSAARPSALTFVYSFFLLLSCAGQYFEGDHRASAAADEDGGGPAHRIAGERLASGLGQQQHPLAPQLRPLRQQRDVHRRHRGARRHHRQVRPNSPRSR